MIPSRESSGRILSDDGGNGMSKFSEYLKEILSRQEESIAGIAKNAGLERTSIHKALKDERILSYTALKKLTRYLQLTLPQVRELTRYYEMLLRGRIFSGSRRPSARSSRICPSFIMPGQTTFRRRSRPGSPPDFRS